MRPVATDVIRNVVCVVTPGSPAIRLNRSLAGFVGGQTRMDFTEPYSAKSPDLFARWEKF